LAVYSWVYNKTFYCIEPSLDILFVLNAIFVFIVLAMLSLYTEQLAFVLLQSVRTTSTALTAKNNVPVTSQIQTHVTLELETACVNLVTLGSNAIKVGYSWIH